MQHYFALMNLRPDVICIQEMRIYDVDISNKKGIIPGYNVHIIFDAMTGVATYVREGLENKLKYCLSTQDQFTLIVNVCGINISNTYLHPRSKLTEPLFPSFSPEPLVFLGDFNAQHKLWDYGNCQETALKMLQFALDNKCRLMFRSNGRATFHSPKSRAPTNPDLCFVSENLDASREVLSQLYGSFHRIILINVQRKKKINEVFVKNFYIIKFSKIIFE